MGSNVRHFVVEWWKFYLLLAGINNDFIIYYLLYLFDTKREKKEGDMYENIITSPLIIWSMANKYREATFMRISGVL